MTRNSILRNGIFLGALLPLLPFLPGAAAAHAEESAANGNTLRFGVGAGFGPRYSGSDQNTGSAALMFDYQMQNGFFASSMRGLGYGSSSGAFSYSAALAYRSGRSESDKGRFNGSGGSNYLRGMGDIKGSATALLSVGYAPIKWISLNAVAELPLSQRENGKAYHFGVTGILYDADRDKLSLSTVASVGDRKYSQTYYGVSDEQAGRSGFAAYRPKAGLYAVNAELTWEHKFDPTWSLVTMVGAGSLTGDAAKSPIVKRKTAPVGGIYLSYTY